MAAGGAGRPALRSAARARILLDLRCSDAASDPVAQLVEHLTFNQRVDGSSPSGITAELALDRAKAAILGLSVSGRPAPTTPTQIGIYRAAFKSVLELQEALVNLKEAGIRVL